MTASMKNSLRQKAVASERVDSSRYAAGSKQMGFSFDAKQRVIEDQEFLTAIFQEATRAAGTIGWLTAALDRPPSYESKINDAIAGREERPVQLPWLAPLLDDPDAAFVLISRLCERCGFMPPVREKVADRAELAEAALEVLAELKDEEQRELMRKRVAKKVGVRAEDVKL